MMTQINKCSPKNPKQALKRKQALDQLFNPSFFKAFSDGNRLRLLACLSKCARPCSLGEIAECCNIDFSVVSRHMLQLNQAGIVKVRKEGRAVYYSTNYKKLTETFFALAEAFEKCCPDLDGESCCGG